MEITQPAQLTGPVIRQLRESLGLTLKRFWMPLGVSTASGSHYELETHLVAESTQKLVYLTYVCGIPHDLPDNQMKAIGQLARSTSGGIEALLAAISRAQGAIESLNRAHAQLLEQ